MTTVEYVLDGPDNHPFIKRITVPDAVAARYYVDYLASFGIDSWISPGISHLRAPGAG